MFPVIGFPLAAFAVSASALALCADVKLAMRRANLDQKRVAIEIRAREPKLSAQLNGQEPFTLFWRFTVLDDAFHRELNEIRADRFGQRVIPSDVGTLVESVETLHKTMAKMALPEQRKERSA